MTDCKRRFDDTQQQNLLKNVNSNNITHIQDCIDKFNQTEQLDDQNTWYCKSCKTNVNAYKTMSISRLPNTLVLNLKRFRNDSYINKSKNSIAVKYPIEEYLDLSK